MSPSTTRWAWIDVDFDAIRHNVGQLRAVVAPSALWAVVKANGYGHGALDVAGAALDAGAEGLCVALVQEGIELRDAGIDAPILVLSEQPPDAVDDIVRYRLMATVYTASFIDVLAGAARARKVTGVPVHLKIDSGMQRVGAQPETLDDVLASLAANADVLRLVGVFTHLALADEPTDGFTDTQLARLDAQLRRLDRGPDADDEQAIATDAGTSGVAGLLIHAANSAAALAHPSARRSLVRAGIAIYGISPGKGVDHLCEGLRPALSLRARVSHVKQVVAGSGVSYGLRHTFERDTTVATVPIGYADGVPRRLSSTGGTVLIGGRRRPIVGVVTMDQLMVDCGPDDGHEPVAFGDEVVLIGEQHGPDGLQRIGVDDWADRLGTIGYEIVCGLSSRLPRLTSRIIGADMVEGRHA